MIRWIKTLFTSTKPSEKVPFPGWDNVTNVLVVYDEHKDDVLEMTEKWRGEGKRVELIQWITPKPKKAFNNDNAFSDRDIRFGKFKDKTFAERWQTQVLVDCTVNSHKRFKRLLRKPTWHFAAGLNDAHAEVYDLYIPPKGNFSSRLTTLITYLNFINKQITT